MKQKYAYTVYVLTGFVLAAGIFLALIPVNAGPQAALARDIPGVNTPVVTTRLVEIRTTRIETQLPVVEKPFAPPLVQETLPDAATFYFAPPADPVVEAPPAINLVVLPDVTYRLEPLKEQPARVTFVH